MKQFTGFPAKMQFTPLPNVFFSALLPQIDDVAELKATLHVFAALYRKRGHPRFVTRSELLGNKSLMSSLSQVKAPPEQVLTDTQAGEVVSIDDALRYCGVAKHLQQQSEMYAQLRSDNIIVADTPPAYMHSTLITEYMALKRSGIF